MVTMDDGSEFFDRHVNVHVGDYADCANADIVVVTAGRRPPQGSNRLQELGFTVGIVGQIVDDVMASGFDGVLVMVSNPVDVMAWYAWKRSGLPRSQVLGTGTALDTSRLKTIIGEETGLDPRNVGGFVMGEHGDSQFVPWSTVSIGGKPFARFLSDNQDRFSSVSLDDLERKTRDRGNAIKDAKGGTNYGIASTVAGIVQTILWDERRIVPVSTLLDGEYGEHDVFLGVPTELRANGANEIVEFDLQDVRDADIILVNYNKPSIGTSMEVFYAAHNLGKFVVAFSPFEYQDCSPWMARFCTKILGSLEEAAGYINTHFSD